MTSVGLILLSFGVVILVVSSLGLFVFKDALSRQHAATKSGSLGVVAIVFGAVLIDGGSGWWVRGLIIIAFVWLTMPVASHVLARAALKAKQLDRNDIETF
ncbi:MAG: sodium:proton antiporter [Desulfuromonas sp.]|nr:MAG: sodium:proton antiporter [Desulfuromonas sp.]